MENFPELTRGGVPISRRGVGYFGIRSRYIIDRMSSFNSCVREMYIMDILRHVYANTSHYNVRLL